jgi:uncharacterized protein
MRAGMPDDSRIAEALRRLLRAEVYLPLPAAIALLFALIVFTASLTVIITYLPASAPELSENPRIAEFETSLAMPAEAAALPVPDWQEARATSAPVADVTPPARAATAQPQIEAPQRLLPLRNASAAGSLNAGVEPTAAASPAAAPKRQAAALPAAAKVEVSAAGTPVAAIEPSENAAPATAAQMTKAATLMPRRYASAVSAPERAKAREAIPPAASAILPGENAFPAEDGKPWRKYAAAVPAGAAGKPKIVIVIDDMGNAPKMTAALAALDGPLTFAFLPYVNGLAEQTALVRAHGHELLLHLPMEPQGSERPGPHALTESLSDSELSTALAWNLSRFDGYVGVNNHMGSRLTADPRVMRLVLTELKARGLLFLDSMTTPDSVAGKVAVALDMPTAKRDVFLDNDPSDPAIHAQLMVLERTAREQGFAIAICHPNRATLRALASWIPTAAERGFALVPLSAVAEFEGKRRLAVAGGQ